MLCSPSKIILGTREDSPAIHPVTEVLWFFCWLPAIRSPRHKTPCCGYQLLTWRMMITLPSTLHRVSTLIDAAGRRISGDLRCRNVQKTHVPRSVIARPAIIIESLRSTSKITVFAPESANRNAPFGCSSSLCRIADSGCGLRLRPARGSGLMD